MIRIGDFSRLGQVTVQALRHYGELGLLKPVQVDRFTGYRYYSVSQLPRLNRILALKDLGFSLAQVGQVLDEGLSPEQLRGMLRLKRAELQQDLAEAQTRLARVETRLRQIETEAAAESFDVLLKKTEPQWVAALRRLIPSYQAVGALFGELYAHLAHQGFAAGLGAVVWHDAEHKESEVDAEAIAYLKRPVPVGQAGRLNVYELPAADVASVVHQGALESLHHAYEAVLRWIEANDYQIAAPPRELYLALRQPVGQDNEGDVTEIQIPVAKA